MDLERWPKAVAGRASEGDDGTIGHAVEDNRWTGLVAVTEHNNVGKSWGYEKRGEVGGEVACMVTDSLGGEGVVCRVEKDEWRRKKT